jgi:hypothetical protein
LSARLIAAGSRSSAAYDSVSWGMEDAAKHTGAAVSVALE